MKRSIERTLGIVSFVGVLGVFALVIGGCDAWFPGDAAQRSEDSPILAGKSPGPSFEVWLVDQSNSPGLTFGGTIQIYDGHDLLTHPNSALAANVIDLSDDTAALCLAATGANPVRPHMLFFDSTHQHAVLSFVASGHVVVFDAETREPITCIRTSAGAGGARQAHAAYPAADDSYILVANQNGKLLERIDTDVDVDGLPYEHAGDIALDPAATLDLATCTTPHGAACQAAGIRPDNAPICPIVDSSSSLSFVTLRGGGMFVVDPTTSPMSIVAEYDAATVHGNGCGGIEADESMFINSGGGTASNLSEFDVYRFPLTGYSPTNPPNTPPAGVVFSDDASLPTRDSHGAVATKHERYLWVADRARNLAEVFRISTNSWVNTVSLIDENTDDPSPDLVDIAPTGSHLFFSFRGPTPLTGDPHVSTGSTPGVGVVKLKQNGRNGRLRGIARISNIDAAGVERADPHGIRVRRLDVDDDDDDDPPSQGPLALPDDWSGTWQVTITARNCATGEIVAVDEYEDLVCPGEIPGERLLPVFEECDADASETRLYASCARETVIGGCLARSRLSLDLHRQSELLSGQGYWFGVLEAACDVIPFTTCERFEIAGLRVNDDTSTCANDPEDDENHESEDDE